MDGEGEPRYGLETEKKVERETSRMVTTITVDGMSCGGCERNVVDALEDISGVSEASADHENGTATVEGEANIDELVTAVENAGYSASP